MRSDFELIVRQFGDDIKIYPIADVHYGALTHMESVWNQFLATLANDPNAYVILDGDLINNNTRSSVGSPFEDVIRPQEQKRIMTQFLEPIKDKILCIVSGNHERRSLRDADDDPTYDIAVKLDLEDIYRQDAAFLKLQVGERNKREGRNQESMCTYTFAVTHGAGGGIYTGATVNRNERWGNVIEGIDGLIVGHTHKPTVTKPAKLVVDTRNNVVAFHDYVVISCCAWQTYTGYPLQKMMLPASAGNPQVLHLSKSRRKKIEVRW